MTLHRDAYDDVVAERDAALTKVAEMEQTTYCAYCAQQFTLDDNAAAKVTEHIYTCDKHPMRDVEQQRDQLRKVLVEIEFIRFPGLDHMGPICPQCGCPQDNQGHNTDCALHAALTATGGKETDD